MIRIRLAENEWEYDPGDSLGPPGGFGAVFAGRGGDNGRVAVKLLHLEAGGRGKREMNVASELAGRSLRYVIPILDSGIDAESGRFFVVMARGDESLQNFLEREGPMSEERAVRILDEIATGLEEISDLVHRDLKPANLILHDGVWKIADLGIARFVEDSTSIGTLKGCLSPPYASPEQWRLEHATWATDVYALGCIAHTLLTGRPPFSGPTTVDYQRQHLFDSPPILPASPRLQQLVLKCLSKSPAARVRPATVRARLAQLRPTHGSAGPNPLAAAGAKIASMEATMEARRSQTEAEARDRAELASAGVTELRGIMSELFSTIEAEATPSRRLNNDGRDSHEVQLGQGALYFRVAFPRLDPAVFQESKWEVVAGALIGVRQTSAQYPGRSANLWYADLERNGAFRWVEVPYMTSPFARARPSEEPFGFADVDQLHHAALAASPVMAMCQQAAMPEPIDLEYQERFFARWQERLAQAAENRLPRPSSLPE